MCKDNSIFRVQPFLNRVQSLFSNPSLTPIPAITQKPLRFYKYLAFLTFLASYLFSIVIICPEETIPRHTRVPALPEPYHQYAFAPFAPHHTTLFFYTAQRIRDRLRQTYPLSAPIRQLYRLTDHTFGMTRQVRWKSSLRLRQSFQSALPISGRPCGQGYLQHDKRNALNAQKGRLCYSHHSQTEPFHQGYQSLQSP